MRNDSHAGLDLRERPGKHRRSWLGGFWPEKAFLAPIFSVTDGDAVMRILVVLV
jgi:hypothetical protein